MKKPVILITNKFETDNIPFGVGDIVGVRSNYCRAVEKAGGVPVLSALGDPEAYAELADGVLFTGGADVNPARYGEEALYAKGWNDQLDEMELRIFDAFYKRKKPIFGICRGIQTINVALGGTLVQDIPAQVGISVHNPEAPRIHPVQAAPGSAIHRLFGEEFITNTFHHESVKDCGRGLVATAKTADGVVEAVEHESLPILAVQWHPERMIGEECFDLPDMMPLFEHFVQLCSK